jgi:hypothetical protein
MNACRYCEPDSKRCPGYGLCHCGCGEKTRLHRTTCTARGIKRGDVQKYLRDHHTTNPANRTPPLTMAEIKALGG